jgi:O-antigen ligase
MTSLLAPLADPRAEGTTERRDAPELDAEPRRRQVLGIASSVSVVAAILVWALPVTHGTGGRASWVLATGLLSLLPALVLVRPWRTVPTWQLMVALSPAAAAVTVCLTAPTGFDGLDEAAAYVYCAGLFVVVRGWASDGLRRRAVLLLLALVGLEQFTQAYLPWWGSGNVSTMMTGTFYWHNQFAAFMLGTGLVAAVLAVRGSGLLRTVGWVVAPFCIAALLFSGSRASLAILVACWLILTLLSVLDRRGRLAVVTLAVAGVGLATVLSSPWFMDTSGLPTSTVQAREADQSAEGNGRSRLYLWRAAVEVGLEQPVTGAGFDSFAGAGSVHMPADQTMSIYAHNGYLQALSDGGLVLMGAVVAATGAPAVAALRLLWRRRRGDELLAVAVPLSLLALLLHTSVDFDWAYPSLLALFAVLSALLPGDTGTARSTSRSWAAVALLVVLVLASVPAATRASGLRATAAGVPPWLSPVAAVLPVHGTLDWLPASGPCRLELTAADASTRRHGLRCTAAAAEHDPGLQLSRAGSMVANGSVHAGLALADEVLREYGARRPSLVLRHAVVLAEAGRRAAALEELTRLRARYVAGDMNDQVDQVDLVIQSLTTDVG